MTSDWMHRPSRRSRGSRAGAGHPASTECAADGFGATTFREPSPAKSRDAAKRPLAARRRPSPALPLALLAAVLFLLVTSAAPAAPNPFTGGGQEAPASPFTGSGPAQPERQTGQSAAPAPTTVHDEAGQTPPARMTITTGEGRNPYQALLRLSVDWQRELRTRLGAFARDIRTRPFGPSLWLFLGLTFLYGVVHAIGPGHGKSVLCSYFLSRPGTLARGALMANAIALVHVLSAVLVVFGAFALLETGMRGFDGVATHMETASYALLLVIGLWLVWNTARTLLRGGPLHCHHDHDPDSLRDALLVAFVTGLVPCPGAAIILTFTLTLHIAWAGVLSMGFVALGMGITTSAFAAFAIVVRGTALRLADANSRVFNVAYGALSLLGAACILAFGAVMLLGSMARGI